MLMEITDANFTSCQRFPLSCQSSVEENTSIYRKHIEDSCLFQHLSLTPLTLACLFGMVSINWFLFPVIRAYPLRLNLRCCCIWFQVPAYIITLHDLLALTPHDHVERNTLEYAQSVLEDLSTVSLIGLHLLT